MLTLLFTACSFLTFLAGFMVGHRYAIQAATQTRVLMDHGKLYTVRQMFIAAEPGDPDQDRPGAHRSCAPVRF